MKSESINFVVTNAKVKWAKVFEPDGTFPPARWSVNIYPNALDRDELSKHGIQFRTDEKDGGLFFVAKRNVETQAGKKMDPPRVVDGLKKPFAQPIGNGSVCNVIVNIYPWTFGKKTGIGAWLEAVQVVEHVPYEASDRPDFDAVGAATAGAATKDDMPF